MEKVYNLNGVSNNEIRFRWIRLGLLGKWKDAVARAVEMVTEQGRMKYLRPLYRYNNENSIHRGFFLSMYLTPPYLGTCMDGRKRVRQHLELSGKTSPP